MSNLTYYIIFDAIVIATLLAVCVIVKWIARLTISSRNKTQNSH